MADTKTDIERSQNMAAVKSKNTNPELKLRKAVWQQGIRFFTPSGWKTLTGKSLPGSPDLIFPRARLAIFVDGCFWHGCPLHYTEPEDNREFWQQKLRKNLDRDARVNTELRALGWEVLRFWEHELRRASLPEVIDRIVRTASHPPVGKEHAHEGELSGLYGRTDPDGNSQGRRTQVGEPELRL